MEGYKFYWSVLLCLLIPASLCAQWQEDDFHYGFFAGGTYSRIDDIQTTIIQPIFPSETYSTSTNFRFGAAAGFFIYHRFLGSSFAIQPEISYAMYGGDFKYSDVNDLDYTITFDYQYLNLGILMKIYPFQGAFISVGPQIGLSLDNTNLTYTSNMPELGPDLQIQQSLREVLKGQPDFSATAGIGYEFEFGLSVEGRFKYGLNDVIETQANGFNFIENKNINMAFQLNVAYAIPFYR